MDHKVSALFAEASEFEASRWGCLLSPFPDRALGKGLSYEESPVCSLVYRFLSAQVPERPKSLPAGQESTPKYPTPTSPPISIFSHLPLPHWLWCLLSACCCDRVPHGSLNDTVSPSPSPYSDRDCLNSILSRGRVPWQLYKYLPATQCSGLFSAGYLFSVFLSLRLLLLLLPPSWHLLFCFVFRQRTQIREQRRSLDREERALLCFDLSVSASGA